MYTVTINGEPYSTTSDKEMAQELKEMLGVCGDDLIEIVRNQKHVDELYEKIKELKMTICNKYALELVRDIIPTSSCEIETKLVDLILWAYEQGSIEGIEAYREDENPTEQQEWERSR